MKILVSDAAREAAGVVDAILRRRKGNWPSPDFFQRDHGRVWSELSEGGWLDLGLAEAQGGAGFHLLDLAAVAEAWGRHLVPLPFVPTVLIHRWSGDALDGFAHAPLTFALVADGGAAAPFLGLGETRAVRALKPLACIEAAADERDTWAPSLPIATASEATAGLPAVAPAEIAVLAVAELIGCGATALEQSIAYARDRTQFGRAIAEYQAVQHRLANMHRDLEVARSALVWAANDLESATRAVAVGWDRIRAITETCIQIHGGFGFTWEAGLHYYARHVRAWGGLLQACGARLWPA